MYITENWHLQHFKQGMFGIAVNAVHYHHIFSQDCASLINSYYKIFVGVSLMDMKYLLNYIQVQGKERIWYVTKTVMFWVRVAMVEVQVTKKTDKHGHTFNTDHHICHSCALKSTWQPNYMQSCKQLGTWDAHSWPEKYTFEHARQWMTSTVQWRHAHSTSPDAYAE